MNTNLSREWAELCRWPTSAEQVALDRFGITVKVMTLAPGLGIQIAHIEASGEHFQFTEAGAGRKAVILITDLIEGDEGAEIVDLLAFEPDRPDQWWLRLGIANWLAAYQLDRRTVCGLGAAPLLTPLTMPDGYTVEALHLHRDPLSWLRAGCRGAVPLVPEALNDLRFLDTTVLCEDLAHAEEIEQQLLSPAARMPVLQVPISPEAAA